jgi:hypothetical protein
MSLSLASTGTSSFDLSWLDGLPASDDPKLFDCMAAGCSFSNTRVTTAEVFEWQGRHKEAIRSCFGFRSYSYAFVCTNELPDITALRLLTFKTASTFP